MLQKPRAEKRLPPSTASDKGHTQLDEGPEEKENKVTWLPSWESLTASTSTSHCLGS